jgi:hypothetical protein
MQNGDNRTHRGGLSSRAESEAINPPIIEEFARLFHHILANLHLSLGLWHRRADFAPISPSAFYDAREGRLFRTVSPGCRIILTGSNRQWADP